MTTRTLVMTPTVSIGADSYVWTAEDSEVMSQRHIRTSWRYEVGKKLTNKAITREILEDLLPNNMLAYSSPPSLI